MAKKTAAAMAKKPKAKKAKASGPPKKRGKRRTTPPKKEIMERSFYPETGTRFKVGTAQQAAFELIFKAAKKNKSGAEIRAMLANENRKVKKDVEHSLDSGYFPFVMTYAPEFLKENPDGTIEVVGEPQVDKDALKQAKKALTTRKADKVKRVRRRKAVSEQREQAEEQIVDEVDDEDELDDELEEEEIDE